MAELRKTRFKIDGRRFTLTGEIDEPAQATAARSTASEQATSPTPPNSPAPKSAKQRNSELYKRRREEGWRKDWICPSLDAAGQAAGGLDKLAAAYLQAQTALDEAQREIQRLKKRSIIDRILNR